MALIPRMRGSLAAANLLIATCGLVAAASSAAAAEPREAERWDGAITFGKLKLPFSMQFRIDGSKATATLTNLGETSGSAVPTTGTGTVAGEALQLRFAGSGAAMEGKLDGGSLKGHWVSASGVRYSMEAGKFCTCGFAGEAGPDISGTWEIDSGTATAAAAAVPFRKFTLTRKGDDTFAVLQAGGGGDNKPNSPALAGRFDGAVFTLSYFDGDPARAAWLEIEPSKDGKTAAIVFQKPNENPVKLAGAKR